MNAASHPERRRLLSVADFHRIGEAGVFAPDERIELIEGEIVTMPPIGPAHASLVGRLTRALVLALGERAIVYVQNPMRLSELSEPEPDLAVLHSRDDFYADAHPGPEDTLLAIEVSDSTLAYDRDVKVPLYARHGVPEAWLLDVREGRAIAYSRPKDGVYRRETVHRPPATLTLAGMPDVALDLSDLLSTD